MMTRKKIIKKKYYKTLLITTFKTINRLAHEKFNLFNNRIVVRRTIL